MTWRTDALPLQVGWAHDSCIGSSDHNVRQNTVDRCEIAHGNPPRDGGDHAGAVGEGQIKSATANQADQVGINLILNRYIKARGGISAALLCQIEGSELHSRDVTEADGELHRCD